MEKFTAASIFRGESAEQALLTVRGSGNFTAELTSRVMRRADGHTDDLETLFARYNELEEKHATETADWAASQLAIILLNPSRNYLSHL
jgi:hypothetical protein